MHAAKLSDINRSEAHFAALLFHELNVHESDIAKNLRAAIDSKLSARKAVGACQIGNIEAVYFEPAPFRDWWNNNSDNKCRQHLLDSLINALHRGEFTEKWTFEGKKNEPLLRSPFTWSDEFIQGLSECGGQACRRAYWIFRARPDLLLVTAKFALWIEIKVEEAVKEYDGSATYGVEKKAFNQLRTQVDIAEHSHLVVQEFDNKTHLNVVIQPRKIQPNPSAGKVIFLTWDDITKGNKNWSFDILHTTKRNRADTAS